MRTRRGMLGQGLRTLGGAVLLGSSAVVLGGCAATGGHQASPVATPAPEAVTFYPWQGWPNFGGPHWAEFAASGLRHFEQAHRGIRVVLGETKPGPAPKYAAAILAGAGPDVFSDWAVSPYLEGRLVLNLAPYLQRDNVNPGIWSPGQMRTMQDAHGVWFVPDYVHVDAMVVNFSLLDRLGLAYPSPDWTYTEAERLFLSASGVKAGQRRYGVHLDFPGGSLGTGDGDLDGYVLHRFGGAVMDGARRTALVDRPAALQALDWHLQLYWNGIAASGPPDLLTTPFMETGSNLLLQNLSTWSNRFKWTYFPVPRFPAGQFSFEATDFLAISAGTKHPDAAWTLLRWLAADPWWSRYCMRLLLRTPSLTSLWQEYVAVVEAAAPPAKGKGVHWFAEAAAHWGLADRTFAVADVESVNAINAQLRLAFARQVGLGTAMRSAAAQVDALQRSAANRTVTAREVARGFPSAGRGIAAVTPGL